VFGEVVSVPSLSEQAVRGGTLNGEATVLTSPLAVHRSAVVPRGRKFESGH